MSRDFSDVRMVVQYFRRLLETPSAAGQVYNICTGRPYSLKYIIAVCEKITGRRIEVRVNPDFVRANEIKSLVGSPEKLQTEMGMVENYPLEKTLEWMLQS